MSKHLDTSSRMMDLSNMAYHKREADLEESIRDKNITRLRMLDKY